MSNHFTGLSLGPPMGDQRLDLCDLYAFQSPTDATRTAIILNANPQADGFHPDAIYQHRHRRRLPHRSRLQLRVLAGEGRQAERQRLSCQGSRGATSELGDGTMHIWGRCSLRRDGQLIHVDRAGHPSVSSFFNTDDTKKEYNASEPVNDRKRWLEMFIHLMGHTGNYSREESIAAIDADALLPDILHFDSRKPAQYPNGRVFTDEVIDHRLAFLTRNECPPSGLKPHTDTLGIFPYLGTPHAKKG